MTAFRALSRIYVVFLIALLVGTGSVATAQQLIPTTISSNGGGASAITVASSNLHVTRVTATGSANSNVEYYILGGRDANKFTIDRYMGEVTLRTVPAVAEQGPYEVIVGLVDSNGFADQQRLTVVLPGVRMSVSSNTVLPQCGETVFGTGTKYIYDQSIHSVDILLAHGYTAQAISMSGEEVPSRYVSIWQIPGISHVKVHIDVPEELSSDTDGPITLSILDQSLSCLSTLSISSGDGSRETFDSTSPTGTGSSTGGNTGASGSSPQGSAGASPVTPGAATTSTGGEQGATTTSETAGVCTSPHVSIWIILTLLYGTGLVAAAMFLRGNGEQSRTAQVITALVSFLVLMALWYFLDECRETLWFPIIASIMTILAILNALRSEGHLNSNYPMLTDGNKNSKK
jgi:hypothetical protein